MPGMTPGYAKNTIRRALRAVVDPEPSDSQISSLWEFFGLSCAYCGRTLNKGDRQGHVDHLEGASNHISNRVLACSICNGDKKLDKPWLDFLRAEVKDTALFEARRQRIEAWKSRPTPPRPVFDLGLLTRESERAEAAFDKAVDKLRRSRNT